MKPNCLRQLKLSALMTSAVLLLMVACDGPTPPDLPGPAAALNIVSGDDQSGVVGTQLQDPLVVQVRDADGDPVPGQVLNFRVVAGNGSVFAGAAQTNSEGKAQERWTLGTVAGDTQKVEVRAVDASTGAPLVFATFNAIGRPGPPARIQKASADSTHATVTTEVTPLPRVRVLDHYDNPVSGIAVTFSAAGGGTVTGAEQTTQEDGYATVGSWTLGANAGTNTLTATAAGSSGLSVQFTVVGDPANATQLVIEQAAAGAQAGAPFVQQPRIAVLDAYGNRVPNGTEAVTMTVSGGATLLGAAAVAPSGGVATFSDVGLRPAGSYTLSYSASIAGTIQTVSQVIVVAPGAPAKYIVIPGAGSVEVGANITFSAQLTDADGSAISRAGERVTWGRAVGVDANGTFESATSLTNSSGIATVVFTPDTVFTASSATITATDDGGRFGAATVAVNPGAAAKIAFVAQPANAGYLITLPAVSVAIQDRYGNTLTSENRQVELVFGDNPGGATLAGGSPITSTSGVATFRSLTVNRGGSGYTLVARSAGLQPGTSTTFDVSAVGVVVNNPGDGLHAKAGQVYYSDDRYVYRVPSTGGSPTMMNNPQCCIYWKQIVSDDTYIYYVVLLGMNIRGLSFRRTPLLGLPGAEVIMGGGGGSLWQPRAVAFDGRYFYYSGSGTIQDTKTARLGVPQGDTLTLFTTALNGFVAGDGYLFFFEGDTLKSVPRDGGTPSTVVSDIGPVTSMIVANGTIYWSTGTDIKSVPVTGGPVTTRATMANGVAQRLVSDGTSLYVRVDAVSIVRFDLSTFASTTIVQNDVIADFAVDHESVYWVSTDPASGARMVKKTRK